jgi:VanZ family protein
MNAIRDDRRTMFACAGWWLALALLGYGLLSPTPPKLNAAILPEHLTFWASKGVHLGAFAFLAMVAGLLAIAPRHRLLLGGTLVAFAPLSEYLQTFVEGRSGCKADVCIDLAGITLGVGLALGWRAASSAWSRRPASATTPAT